MASCAWSPATTQTTCSQTPQRSHGSSCGRAAGSTACQPCSANQPQSFGAGIRQPGYTSYAWIPGSLFSQLLQLTHLELDGGDNGLTAATFQHLGCLTNLQHLRLKQASTQPHYLTAAAANGLAGLSQLTQLTCLSLEGVAAALTAHSTPQLAPLTNLRLLSLSHVPELDPTILADMMQLEYLSLVSTQPINGAAGVAALLKALQGMQQLTFLWLQNVLSHRVEEAPPAWLAASHAAAAQHAAAAAAAAEQYAALTDSPGLQVLFLSGAVLPPAAWQHMFAPNKHLPCLRFIDVSVGTGQAGAVAYMTSADLTSLVQCCPNLETLRVGWAAVWSGVSLAPLLQLKRLTELHVHGVQQQSDADVLMQLTGLRYLSLDCQGDVVGPQHLAAFSRLPRCRVVRNGVCILGYKGQTDTQP